MPDDASQNPSLPPNARASRSASQGPSFSVSVHLGHAKLADWPEHTHEEIEALILLGDGECTFAWRPQKGPLKQRHLKSGQICLIGPSYSHAATWGLKAADYVVLHLKGDFTHPPLDGVVFSDLTTLAQTDLLIWELAKKFRSLCREKSAGPPLYIEALGIVLIKHLLDSHLKSAQGPGQRGLTPAQIAKVKEFIQKNLKKRMHVEELARHVHFTKFHFTRLFQISTGQTPHQYVISARVLRADELLRTGNYRISEIAYEVGFCDQSHLDRHYTRVFGISPNTALKQYIAQ